MEVVAVRGSSYVSDNTKINPNQLSEKQMLLENLLLLQLKCWKV